MLALPSSLAPNPDPPNIGSLFQVLPRKMACVLGLKPKVERFRVVVVWECETREVERLTARLAKALAGL